MSLVPNPVARAFCFTLNNYTGSDCDFLASLPPPTRYICFGREVGEEEKTPHLQGYLECVKPTRISGLRKVFGNNYHWEKRRGTPREAIDYCKKDGDFEEYGTLISQGHRSDLAKVVDACKTSLSFKDAVDKELKVFYYPKSFDKYRFDMDTIEVPAWRDVEVLVFIGSTGTGKTRLAMTCPNAFKLDKANSIWWDGYNRHATIIIDDFYGWIPWGSLLNILDGHRLRLEIKGGFKLAFYTRVIITSNRDIHEWYHTETVPDISPLERRINRIIHFPTDEELVLS